MPELEQLAAEGSIAWERRAYAGPEDLEGAFMVIASTDDTDINIAVYDDAERRAMLVNVVDVPPLCNFILPAIVRTGPLAIAISTAGASPALAKRMKPEVAELFGEEYAELAVMLNDVRGWAKGTLPTYQDRKDVLRGDRQRRPRPDRAAARGRPPGRARPHRGRAQRGRAGLMGELTHLDDEGTARMVDVGAKEVTARRAVARARRAHDARPRPSASRPATRRRATSSASRASPASRRPSAPAS